MCICLLFKKIIKELCECPIYGLWKFLSIVWTSFKSSIKSIMKCFLTQKFDFLCMCTSGFHGLSCDCQIGSKRNKIGQCVTMGPCDFEPCGSGNCQALSDTEYVCHCQTGVTFLNTFHSWSKKEIKCERLRTSVIKFYVLNIASVFSCGIRLFWNVH